MIKEELEKLHKKHGNLTAEIVLNEAKRKKSPLHDYFEWDDSTAAHKWRMHQARQLIISVKVETHENEPTKTRYFIHNGSADEDAGYDTIDMIVNDPDLMEKTLRRFQQDARNWIDRIRGLGEYKNLSIGAVRHLDSIDESIDALVLEYQNHNHKELAPA